MQRMALSIVSLALSIGGCADAGDAAELMASDEVALAAQERSAEEGGATAPAPQVKGEATDGARYAANGRLMRPDDYREWIYLSSGLGMTYGPNAPQPGAPRFFDNVFVNRESYKHFLATGTWLEKTTLVLEVRRSRKSASIDGFGDSQGDVVAIEVEIKDSARFPNGGWGFFDFGGESGLKEATPFPATAACYSCHREHTAVDNTFVQFYPTLMRVAERMGTVRSTFDPNRKIR